MRTFLGNWKYILKNFWWLLPFALLPAVTLALSVDLGSVCVFVESYLSGTPCKDFSVIFSTLNFINYGQTYGWIGNIVAFFVLPVSVALMLGLVEKHLRIGKHSLNGIFDQFPRKLFAAFCITVSFMAMYELWALIVSALFFMVASFISNTVLLMIFEAVVFLVSLWGFVYFFTAFILWYPSYQYTGMGVFQAFVHAYQLTANVRLKLVVFFYVWMIVVFMALGAMSFLAPVASYAVISVLFVFMYLAFLVRMETMYFEADGLEREDVRRPLVR